MIKLGPILSFRGCADNQWNISILIVSDENNSISWNIKGNNNISHVDPKILDSANNFQFLRYDISVSQSNEEQYVEYRFDEIAARFVVPPVGNNPNLFYCSCNGFSSSKLVKSFRGDKDRLWKIASEKHQSNPYHILLMGGDQIYADEIWELNSPLKKWHELSYRRANKRSFNNRMQQFTDKFYFDLYCSRWNYKYVKRMLASVPTVMMWDDHDIFDGWGSYPEERQNCDVFQGIFQIAKKYFRLFQQQIAKDEKHPSNLHSNNFSLGFEVGTTKILTLDMRSERTLSQIMTQEHWNRIFDWTESIGVEKKNNHLFVMSSIPIVYPNFNKIERLLGWIPGQQSIEDDIHDHWSSRLHLNERHRIIHRLFNFSQEKNIRVTLLSGDVHVGAVGIIKSDRGKLDNSSVINQLTSSGIIHPAPPKLLLFALEKLLDKEEEDRGITSEMLYFPGTRRRYIGKRNWLSIEPDTDSGKNRYWANWIVEGEEDEPYTKVIHPIA